MQQLELFAPPSGDVIWLAGKIGMPKTAAVKSQTWYSARHKASIALGCSVGEVEVTTESKHADF